MRHLSTNTIIRRRKTLRLFARYIEPRPIAEATRDDVEAFISTRRTARTKAAYLSDLRVFYAWLVDRGLAGENPADRIPPVKVPKSLPRPIPTDAALATLTYGTRRVRRMVALALYAGLRCHEIAALQAEDVWLHATPPVLIVRNGKGGKDRTVPIHPALADLLHDLPPAGPVIPGRYGRPVLARTVSRTIAAHLAVGGIQATPHQYRHTYGTEVVRASGGNLLLAASWMGHEDSNTTRGYAQLVVSGADLVLAHMFGGDTVA